jgi:tetratricopeptide (TPR) repeat protein
MNSNKEFFESLKPSQERREALDEFVKLVNESVTLEEFISLAERLSKNWICEYAKSLEEHKICFEISGVAASYTLGDISNEEGAQRIISLCNKGLDLNDKNAYLYVMRGRTYGDMAYFDKALRDLNQAVKIDKKYSDAYVERGMVKHKMDDIGGAEADYNKALRLNPSCRREIEDFVEQMEEYYEKLELAQQNRNENMTKDVSKLYCVYCAEDKDKGHHNQCPFVAGVPEQIEGMRPIPGKHEYNFHLGRSAVQWYLMQSKDPRAEEHLKRLDYEIVASAVRTYLYNHSLREKKGLFKKIKIRNQEKAYGDLLRMAKDLGISKKKLDEMAGQKLIIGSRSSSIPAYRNKNTKELIYVDLED